MQLLLIAIAMFYIWRLLLKLHGQTWKPEGRWESRTEAAKEYMATQPRMTRGQKIQAWVTMMVTLTPIGCFVAFLLIRSN